MQDPTKPIEDVEIKDENGTVLTKADVTPREDLKSEEKQDDLKEVSGLTEADLAKEDVKKKAYLGRMVTDDGDVFDMYLLDYATKDIYLVAVE